MDSPEGSTQQGTTWQARFPIFFGWVIVGIVFLRSFASLAAIWSTSILSVPMKQDLGWSGSTIFLGITLRTLGAAAGSLFWGKHMDHPSRARKLALGSGVISALGLMLVSFVDSPWQFWAIYGVFGGILGAGPDALLTSAIVPKWFIRKRGRAVALSSMGTGLAAFIMPLLVPPFVSAFDWRPTFVALGVNTLILGVLPSFLLRTRPEDVGLRPDGDNADSARQARSLPEVSYTAGQAFRTTTLWLLMGAALFGSFSPTAFPTNLTPTLVDRGYSLKVAGWAFSAYGFTSFTGRFFWGWLADKIHIRYTLLIICTYTGLTIPLLRLLPGDMVLAAGGIAGFGIGGYVGLNQVVWATYFGRENLGAITGKVRPMITLSQAWATTIIAGIADLTGGHGTGIVLMAATWWGSVAFLSRVKPVKVAKATELTTA